MAETLQEISTLETRTKETTKEHAKGERIFLF
jgi:hypothetical protein